MLLAHIIASLKKLLARMSATISETRELRRDMARRYPMFVE